MTSLQFTAVNGIHFQNLQIYSVIKINNNTNNMLTCNIADLKLIRQFNMITACSTAINSMKQLHINLLAII